MENEGKTFEEVLEHHQHKVMLSLEQLQELADLAHQNHITVASHDDDTVEKLQLNQKLGVDISEFPITQEVAQVAHNMGFYTIAGAPNILLGGSHSGNMSAGTSHSEWQRGYSLFRLFPAGVAAQLVCDAGQIRTDFTGNGQ